LTEWPPLVEEDTDELRGSQERYRLLLESVRDGVIGVDREGQVTFVNSAVVQMLHYQPERIIGQQIHHTKSDGSPSLIEACPLYKAYTQRTVQVVGDEMFWLQDGLGFSVEYTAAPWTITP